MTSRILPGNMATQLSRSERGLHAFKTAIACIVGLLVTKALALPVDSWVLVTICVIMCAQVFVGDILQKSYLRLLGTVFGGMLACVVLLTFGANGVSIPMTIVAAAFLFSYLATGSESISYAGTLGALTTVIIMTNAHPSVHVACSRFLEIFIGIAVAAIVSRLIFPIRARDHLIRSHYETLSRLRLYYIKIVMTGEYDMGSTEYYELDEKIASALSAQRQLAKMASRKWFEPAFDRKGFLQSIYCEKEILRSINFMHIAKLDIERLQAFPMDRPSVSGFNEMIVRSLDLLIEMNMPSVSNGCPLPLSSCLADLAREMRKNGKEPGGEAMHSVEAYLFSAGILTTNISKLIEFHEKRAMRKV
jgi:uncharacterized membrane protein YccC